MNIPHGTYGGYTNYGCRCDRCKQAAREHVQDQARRKTAQRGEDFEALMEMAGHVRTGGHLPQADADRLMAIAGRIAPKGKGRYDAMSTKDAR